MNQRSFKLLIIFLICLLILPSVSWSINRQIFSVNFRDTSLRDVVFSLTEITGKGFIFETSDLRINWILNDVDTNQLLKGFEKALGLLGYGLIYFQEGFYQISKLDAVGSDIGREGFGVFRPQWIESEDAASGLQIIFGKRVVLKALKNMVVASGESDVIRELVGVFHNLDQPFTGDFEKIPVVNVPVKQAAEALKDLAVFRQKEMEGNGNAGSGGAGGIFPDYWQKSILIRGSLQQRMVARGVISLLDKVGDRIERVVRFHTLSAKDAVVILDGMTDGVTVRVFGDKGLVVFGPSVEVGRVMALLARIDGATVQVRVSAVIASLSESQFHELGLSLKGSGPLVNLALNGGGYPNLDNVGPGLLIDLIKGDLSGVIHAQDDDSRGEVLSSPILTVLNGQTASINVGQNVPFLGEAVTDEKGRESRSIKRQDVGVSLQITPTVEENGDFVHLDMKQEVSSIAAESVGAVDLITEIQKIESIVRVANGETILLGGVRSQENGHFFERVPLLGWIPIVGQIFTYEKQTKANRYLVIALRPEIITGAK